MGGGGMGQMRDMMHRMMPDLLPPGVEPENLPDPNSSGAKLLVRYCTQCHNLASPSMHTAEEWPVVANRMFRRMSRMSGMGMMNVGYPSSDEQQTIIAYLKAHSLRAISPGAIPSPETQGAVLYKNTCSQCHALPDPQLHTAKEWPAIVDKMLAYAQSMEKKGIVEREKKEILSYLARHARK